jgi:YHS domain-containing protein
LIRRLLFLALAVAALFWWLRKLLARSGAPARRPEQTPGPIQDQGAMVRDRVCNTFLPRSRALSARVESEEHFFCSEKCRDEFLSRQPVRSP